MAVNPGATIESLMLANHVEQSNGLLYISGGGWTDHHRRVGPGGPPPLSHLGIALLIAVPWLETNRSHVVTLEIHDEDGNPPIVTVNAQFNVGRPPTVPPGTTQYPTIALPMDIMFPHTGAYEIVTQIDGSEQTQRTFVFRVHDVPVLAPVV